MSATQAPIQQAEASERSAQLRRERVALLGRAPLLIDPGYAAVLLEELPEALGHMVVRDFMKRVRGWGTKKVRYALAVEYINERKRLRELTERQRRALAKAVRG